MVQLGPLPGIDAEEGNAAAAWAVRLVVLHRLAGAQGLTRQACNMHGPNMDLSTPVMAI